MLSDRIDLAIHHSNSRIRDRSDFGKQAVDHLLGLLEAKETPQMTMAMSIVEIAAASNFEDPLLNKIRKMIEEFDQMAKKMEE